MKMSTEPGFTWIPPLEMKRRINTIPLPKRTKNLFVAVVKRWQANSGTEWTVGRLKAFRDCVVNSYADGGTLSHKPEWFKTARSGKLTGVFGLLWETAMKGDSSLKAVLFLLNIYTGVSYSKVTQPMLEEIKSSIQQEKIRIPKRGYGKVGLTDVYKAFKSLPKVYNRHKRCGLPEPLAANPPGKKGHAEKIPADVLALAGTPLYGVPAYKALVDAALGAENTIFASKLTTVVGSIGITCEPGLKNRYFAFPNVVLQRAVEPLKELFLHALGRFPWDCTLDQRKADKAVATALSSGKTVNTIDMSKATDSFPWEFQLEVGKFLTDGRDTSRQMLDLVDYIVREGYWEMPDGSRVKWTKGQPLGLGPSFPIFTISHGVLLYILNEYSWNQAFYVLGDDVIIMDDHLAQKYRKVLMDWEVGVSEAKSFHSDRIGQFAGVTYTDKGQFHLPKWRPFTRDNILDLEAWWYPGLLEGFPDYSVIQRVLALPEPYGIGRNPKGVPLDERLTPEVVDALIERESRRETLAYATVTRVNLTRLADVIGASTENQEGLGYAFTQMVNSQFSSVTSLRLPEGFRRSTDRPLLARLAPIMDGTYVPGYPRLRRRVESVDPYTLGTLKSWKRLFGRVDSLKSPE